ncbi:MFS transporter [Companilactobacillus allii]|uniref:MFS transporter n=1 Tax=Companilactobacillus allii TaxID=1847728 RepID=A0A1P8Q0R8_9LACO|nr:MFS transporter [Companilactobacillus allii]APX71472.1 MFS transporter [Companilactobacillus allii]USQ68551.1 MFS transporter [Companilactobacillus allii]
MSRNRKILVTFALVLSNMMAGLDATIINTALPAIISDLHGIQYMGWIVAIFLLGMAVSTPLWSKFGEKKGNKVAYITATIVFMIGALFQGLAPNIIWFITARSIMGIGAGGMNTIPFIIYSQIFKNIKRRSQVIGIASAGFSGTSIVGPLIGGWIVDSFSWHWVFYINLPLALLSITIVSIYFNIKEKLNEEKVDYFGAVLMVLGLTSFLIGIQLLGVSSIWITLVFIILGAGLIFWMSRVEEKVEDPIVPNRLFKNEKLVIDLILFALLWGSFVAFNIYIPMWAQGIMGLTALIGGMTQIPGAIANFIGSELEPFMQRRMSRYVIIAIGTLSFLISFAGLFWASQNASYTFLLIMGVFEGFGVGICFNALLIAVQFDVEQRDVPISTSFAYLVRILSQTFMSSIYGVILNLALIKGVRGSHGHITMSMMNKLSNAAVAKELPKAVVPEMKRIFFSGIHNIMLSALILIILVIIILVYLFSSEAHKKSAI